MGLVVVAATVARVEFVVAVATILVVVVWAAIIPQNIDKRVNFMFFWEKRNGCGAAGCVSP